MGGARALSKTALIALAGAACLAACTPMQWVKPGATPEEMSRDATQCQDEAFLEANTHLWPYYRGRRLSSLRNDPFFDEARLTNFCMRIKGYELVPGARAN